MVALCFAAVEGRDGQWDVVKDNVDGQGSDDACLNNEVKDLLEDSLAWHERHPDEKPDLQFPRARADGPRQANNQLWQTGARKKRRTWADRDRADGDRADETEPTETEPTETEPTETEPTETEPTDTTQ